MLNTAMGMGVLKWGEALRAEMETAADIHTITAIEDLNVVFTFAFGSDLIRT
jgi:hypothetical protein